jgi:thiamine biosynthesis lipoprotein
LARTTTDGCFDPWAVPGGFDPSGYVKGWAVQRAAEVLSRHGLHFFAIDGSGDIVCRGGEEVGVPWHIGIRHPDQVDAVIKTVRIFDGATATSGTYERGDHIVNPHDFAAGVAGRAATVVGPDAAMCEVMATVAVVQGVPALHRVAAFGEQWSGLVVVGEKVTSVGPQFAH